MKVSFSIVCLVALLHDCYPQTPGYKFADFTKADSIGTLYPNHSLTDLRILSDKLTTSLSTKEEKFRAIYKWVCNNISNDYTLYAINKNKREKLSPEELKEWNKSFAPRVLRTLVEKHETVCTGYAYLVSELASRAGISCKIVHGYGRNTQANIGGNGIVNHTWNAVQLHGEWYLCDPTWSSGALDMQQRIFVKKYADVYFLTDPTLFALNHYPLDSAWMLLNNKPTLQEYLNAPLVYRTALESKLHPLLPDTFNITTTKGTKVSFQFTGTGEKIIDNVALYVEQSPTMDSAKSKVQPDASTLYTIDHVFSKRGTYAVHILVDGSHAMSYKVTIK